MQHLMSDLSFGPLLLDLLVKGAVLMVVAHVAARTLRRLDVPAAVRRAGWGMAFVGLLLLPLGTAVLPQVAPLEAIDPAWMLTEGPDAAAAGAPVRAVPQAPSESTPSALDRNASPAATTAASDSGRQEGAWPWTMVLMGIWGVVAFALFLRMAVGIARARRLRRESRRADGDAWSDLFTSLKREVGGTCSAELRFHADIEAPLALGVARPTILLPPDAREWPAERRRLVLLHELMHLRRNDITLGLLAQLARASHWPNPLAWTGLRALRHTSEMACDEAVIAMGEDPHDYARQLVDVARRALMRREEAAMLEMARPEKLKRRIQALIERGGHPMPWSTTRKVATTVLLGAVLLGVAALRPLPAAFYPASASDVERSSERGGLDRSAAGAVPQGMTVLADRPDADTIDTPTIVDTAYDARIDSAWTELFRYREARPAKADSLQRVFAEEHFQYYLAHPNTKTGQHAASSAFVMWGNVGAAQRIDEAITHLGPDARAWSLAFNQIDNAYFASEEKSVTDYIALLKRLHGTLTHPRSQGALRLELADYYRSEGQGEQAKKLLQEVVSLDADSIMTDMALGHLYEMESLNVGQQAPDFEATTIGGERVSLSDLRGQVVLIEFWATWCGPCYPEIPYLRDVWAKYQGEDFQLIGVALDRDAEALQQVVDERGITWPQVRQEEGFGGPIAERYNVSGIPRAYLIGPDGTIVAKDFRKEEIEREVRRLMSRIE
jgi:beta-lactamase regulating signal transducer with metallopeptidase domain/peroxiredoxin